MTNYARVRLVVLVTTIVAALGFASAQQVAPPAVPAAVRAATLEQAVPVDPLITVGTLPNGMRYYVRENRQPGARAELRLAVKAGSVLEDEDQRGMAHFVEHMAFNGTTHFPGNAVGTFMQSLGVRFGAHVNAHTGFDETVYELQIPTDNPNVVDRSLLILEDFARAVTFDPTEINQERGVILEEWRLGLGADERINDMQFPLLLKFLDCQQILSNVKIWEDKCASFVGDFLNLYTRCLMLCYDRCPRDHSARRIVYGSLDTADVLLGKHCHVGARQQRKEPCCIEEWKASKRTHLGESEHALNHLTNLQVRTVELRWSLSALNYCCQVFLPITRVISII
jgi:hypothetical protein